MNRRALTNVAFLIFNLLILGVVVYTFTLTWEGPKIPTDPAGPKGEEKSTVPTEKIIKVLENDQSAEKANLPSKENPIFLLSLKCPSGYGVRDITCDYNDKTRDDISLVGFSKNVHSENTYGVICSFSASRAFSGSISAVCDKDYTNMRVFNADDFSPGKHSDIPNIFEIWQIQTAKRSNSGKYEVFLSCPAGYRSSNISCNLDEPVFSGGIKLLRVVNENFANEPSTGKCMYGADKSFRTVIRMSCSK